MSDQSGSVDLTKPLAYFIVAVAQAARDLEACPLEDRTPAWLLDRVESVAAWQCQQDPHISEVVYNRTHALVSELRRVHENLSDTKYTPPDLQA